MPKSSSLFCWIALNLLSLPGSDYEGDQMCRPSREACNHEIRFVIPHFQNYGTLSACQDSVKVEIYIR